jgi:hypothetical protein
LVDRESGSLHHESALELAHRRQHREQQPRHGIARWLDIDALRGTDEPDATASKLLDVREQIESAATCTVKASSTAQPDTVAASGGEDGLPTRPRIARTRARFLEFHDDFEATSPRGGAQLISRERRVLVER